MKKWIAAILAFVLTLIITAFSGFYIAIFLIGPHSDILPDFLHIPAGIFLFIIITGIPVFLARRVFLKFAKK